MLGTTGALPPVAHHFRVRAVQGLLASVQHAYARCVRKVLRGVRHEHNSR